MKEGWDIQSEREIYDFSENKFLLYELNPIGYAIYSQKEDSSLFIEGSYVANSQLYQYANYETRYLGFEEYYYAFTLKHL